MRFKRSLFVVMFGLLVCTNIACTNSPSGTEVENNVNPVYNETIIQMQVPIPNEQEEIQQSPTKPILLSEEQFIQLVADFRTNDKKYKGQKPSVIDFYADWCRPCRMMAPIFEKMAEKYGDRINFYKVDVDISPNISIAYNITGIPTLFFIDSEGTFNRTMGFLSEEEMERSIQSIIK